MPHLSNKQLLLILHLTGWIFLLLASTFFFSVSYGLSVALVFSLVNIIILFISFYGNVLLIRKFIPNQQHKTYAVCFIALIIITMGIRFLINQAFMFHHTSLPDIDEKQRVFLFSTVTTISLLVLSLFLELFRIRLEKEKTYLKVINEQKEAQIQFLRAQINPHFLFNTLNNIYSLAVMKSDATPKMILLLSDLLRYVIYESKDEQVALAKEVEYLQKFIDLYQMRQEIPLPITFEIKGNLQNWHVPPMILMPLIENCFKHGDLETEEHGILNIVLAVTDSLLYFSTVNTYQNHNYQKDKVGGVGLANIRKRLEIQYKGKYTLEINREESLFHVKLSLNKS